MLTGMNIMDNDLPVVFTEPLVKAALETARLNKIAAAFSAASALFVAASFMLH